MDGRVHGSIARGRRACAGQVWAAVFGSDVDEDSTADKAFVEAAGWDGPNMWFIRVPEPKTAKNRLHFDLRAW